MTRNCFAPLCTCSWWIRSQRWLSVVLVWIYETSKVQKDYNIYLAVLKVRYLKGFLVAMRWILATFDWVKVPRASDDATLLVVAFICGCITKSSRELVKRPHSVLGSSSVEARQVFPYWANQQFMIQNYFFDQLLIGFFFIKQDHQRQRIQNHFVKIVWQ